MMPEDCDRAAESETGKDETGISASSEKETSRNAGNGSDAVSEADIAEEKDAGPSRPVRARAAGRWLLRIVQGALIGGGAILPGISGGVLSVTFGLYQPIMELLSHPIRSFRKHMPVFIPFLIGWIAGFLALARVVELMFRTSSAMAIALFIGLVAGTLPSLFRDAGQYGTSNRSWSGFAISMIVLYGFFNFIQTKTAVSIDPNGGWFFFTGAVWGLSLVVPGLSSSSILIFLGLYQPMTAGIADLDFAVILPLLAGIAVTVALSARFVHHLLQNHYSLVFHVILGIIIASTLMIVPTSFTRAQDVFFALASFAAGYSAAWGMSRYGDQVKKNADAAH